MSVLFDMAPTGASLELERHLGARGYDRIAGVDEAGRGCLAGPVVAAAVILDESANLEGIEDSKTLPTKRREELAERIMTDARAWAVGLCSPAEIDQLNILWASMEAMRRALQALEVEPDHVLIDGNTMIPDCPWPANPVIKGDARSLSIAAASILAKTHRDAIMRTHHTTWPAFGWITNVGYPTAAHYEALRAHGPTPLHRQSFRLS